MTHAVEKPAVERTAWLGRVVWSVIGIGLAIGAVFFLGWRLNGGSWYIVETGSMGTTAPAGTLLLVRPVNFATLEAGDFITFHPHARTDEVFSHRVLSVNPNGTISTKGDISAADPWELTKEDVIGRVAHHWWPLGWIIRMLPVLVVGSAIVFVLVRYATIAPLKVPAAVIGGTVVLVIALHVYKPLTHVQRVSADTTDGRLTVTFVGTGIWPVTLEMDGGDRQTIGPGEVARLSSDQPDRDGRVQTRFKPDVPWWGWAVIFGIGIGPGLSTTIARIREEEDEDEEADDEDGPPESDGP